MNAQPLKRRNFKRQGCKYTRTGVAAVECVFCIPVVFLIMFGTLETCSAIFLKDSLAVTAYEGCRVGVRRRATAADVLAECNAILDARGIVDGTVTVTPNDFSGLRALEPITVTVTAPTNGNSTYVFSFMSDREAFASVTMVREFDQ